MIEKVERYKLEGIVEPCPECGSNDLELYSANLDVVLLDEEYKFEYWIFCKNCGFENLDAYGETEYEAVQLWNENR